VIIKKQSNMGGGEFEYEPYKLDVRIIDRKEYFQQALKKIENDIDILGNVYAKRGLGAKENFNQDIIRNLILNNK